MIEDSLLNAPQQIFLKFNANKIRWLSDSKITPTDLFCIGMGENNKKVSLWRSNNPNSDRFEPQLITQTEELDGDITDLKAKSKDELFVSTSNGTVYYFRYSAEQQKLFELCKWSKLSLFNDHSAHLCSDDNQFRINSFDFDSGFDELCAVGEDGLICFMRSNPHTICDLNYQQSCSLNSVKYVKQHEIAVADSLGRIKLWDQRNSDRTKSSMTFSLEGECSPILCMANHPNQQHLLACGNLNGLLFIYDIRMSKKPFILSHNHSEPVMEICFHPFSCDNLLSCSFDGSLWYWNLSGRSNDLWDERNVDAKNLLTHNKYTLNSFDINNDQIIAASCNNSFFRIRNNNFF